MLMGKTIDHDQAFLQKIVNINKLNRWDSEKLPVRIYGTSSFF